MGPAPRDRLHLPVAVNRHYWSISDLLASMSFYNIHPEMMRLPAGADGGLILLRDGVTSLPS